MVLPKFVQVNGSLQSGYYEIQDGDAIAMQNFYTVAQLLEFIDVLLPEDTPFAVNHVAADRNTPVYENFSVDWGERALAFYHRQDAEEAVQEESWLRGGEDAGMEEEDGETAGERADEAKEDEAGTQDARHRPEGRAAGAEHTQGKPAPQDIVVLVNGSPVRMSGKASYVYVDVFDYIDFDLSKPHGSSVYTGLNGEKAEYLREIKDGDVFEIYWQP